MFLILKKKIFSLTLVLKDICVTEDWCLCSKARKEIKFKINAIFEKTKRALFSCLSIIIHNRKNPSLVSLILFFLLNSITLSSKPRLLLRSD
uniref:Uncharacterized protein n=1 Tax=Zosterops lateralis melanops TaxID=1220523 RepID=A0A8D2PGS2_ZOSLA